MIPSDADLLEIAVRTARDNSRRRGEEHLRWIGVAQTFDLTTADAMALCRRYQLDPCERVKR